MSKQKSSIAQPMLIFIPDITGFSKFVNDTDISHSQHIIEELLEALINANEIGLQVSEIEGDAVLFYKEGELDNTSTLLAQIESMHAKFHTHLKMYENSRICQCGACSTANNLKLKFVINYGEVGFNTIKNHIKLFGKEVIVAHRLLKNSVNHAEYALFTNNVIDEHVNGSRTNSNSWEVFESGNYEYDIGDIAYQYINLEPLFAKVPYPEIESYGLKGTKTKVLESDFVIEAPLELVFNVLSDHSIRHFWADRIKDSDHLNGAITHNGSTHRCLINDNKNDPFIVAHDFKAAPDRIVFTETDSNIGFSEVFELSSTASKSTRLQTHTFLEGKYLKPLIFSLFFKKNLIEGKTEQNNKLNEYCKKLVLEGQAPKTQIVLNS
jgi:hypothetical protein